MTTAYAEHSQQIGSSQPSFRHLRLVPNTAPAQGPEPAKILEQTFLKGTAAQGQSQELATVIATVDQLWRELTQHIESARSFIQGGEELSYNHIRIKSVFSVQATYQFVGKLKPRQFPLDE